MSNKFAELHKMFGLTQPCEALYSSRKDALQFFSFSLSELCADQKDKELLFQIKFRAIEALNSEWKEFQDYLLTLPLASASPIEA